MNIAAAYRARQSGSFELPNPLHKYASYNALFTLSALTEGQIKSGSYLTDTKLYSVIARSAGIGPTATNTYSGMTRSKDSRRPVQAYRTKLK